MIAMHETMKSHVGLSQPGTKRSRIATGTKMSSQSSEGFMSELKKDARGAEGGVACVVVAICFRVFVKLELPAQVTKFFAP